MGRLPLPHRVLWAAHIHSAELTTLLLGCHQSQGKKNSWPKVVFHRRCPKVAMRVSSPETPASRVLPRDSGTSKEPMSWVHCPVRGYLVLRKQTIWMLQVWLRPIIGFLLTSSFTPHSLVDLRTCTLISHSHTSLSLTLTKKSLTRTHQPSSHPQLTAYCGQCTVLGSGIKQRHVKT